ncbi:MAG TPA: tyrosine-type recombinase/integrase [Gammaproteobacteria bacterium]|nr:tyrosine-type recombinase/integrase [Gammaproteobacteria bacterium]
MGRKRTPGLVKQNGIWHIDKQIRGSRLCESTGSRNFGEAEAYLARRIEQLRQARVYGVRPERTFRQAATKYLEDAMDAGELRSLERNAQALRLVDPYIGPLPLTQVHMGTLEPYIRDRRKQGIRSGTTRRDLAAVRRVLNLAARLWRDEHGLTWLETPPLIQLPKNLDARKPYPLSWEEQRVLFPLLPAHLQRMALFKVNTGCREQEVCGLRWDWEVSVPELKTSVFIIPDAQVKNGSERLVVLNTVATSVIEEQRGSNSEFVFPYRGGRITRMHNTAWKRSRQRAAEQYPKVFGRDSPEGFRAFRVHDLKHTFGRRLRATGVSFEDRQDLLGHKSGRITTHYSAAELQNLIEAANRVCEQKSRKSPVMVVLRRA